MTKKEIGFFPINRSNMCIKLRVREIRAHPVGNLPLWSIRTGGFFFRWQRVLSGKPGHASFGVVSSHDTWSSKFLQPLNDLSHLPVFTRILV